MMPLRSDHLRRLRAERQLFGGRRLATTKSTAELETLSSASTSITGLVAAASVLLTLSACAWWAARRARFVRRATFSRARLGTSSAFQSRRHNLRGKVEKVPEVLDTFVGQVPVIMSPGELLGDHSLGFERLTRFDDVEVRDALQLLVLGREVILLGDNDALFEEVLENGDSVLLRHQHFDKLVFKPLTTTLE